MPGKTLFLIEEDGVLVSGRINGTVSQTWSGSKVEEIFLIFLMMQLKNILTFGGGSILRGHTLTSTHTGFFIPSVFFEGIFISAIHRAILKSFNVVRANLC